MQATADKALRTSLLPYCPLGVKVSDATWTLPTIELVHEDKSFEASWPQLQQALEQICSGVQRTLYRTPSDCPSLQLLRVVVREVKGTVASTSQLEPGVKQVLLNSHYFVSRLKKGHDAANAELFGVLCHEIVHVWQYDGDSTLPWPLIEGIADYVRIRAGLIPPHWETPKPSAKLSWHSGYSVTGYFLIWIEDGGLCHDFVSRLNLTMRSTEFNDAVIADLTSHPDLSTIWDLYQTHFAASPASLNIV